MRPARTLMSLAIAPILCLAQAQISAQLSRQNSSELSTEPGAPRPLPTTTAEALQQMAARAGVVFVGHVLSVHLPENYVGSPEDATEGLVEVRFAIDVPIRGTQPGESQFLLKEWSGLWTDATPRYRVGERLLVLLHTPSPAGLSSPVDGTDGILPLTGTGPTPSPEDTTATPGTLQVDLRWVQTKLLRQPAPGGPNPVSPDPVTPEPVNPPRRPQPHPPIRISPYPVLRQPNHPIQTRDRQPASYVESAPETEIAPRNERTRATTLFPTETNAVSTTVANTSNLVPVPTPRVPWQPTIALPADNPTAALAVVLALLRIAPTEPQDDPSHAPR